MKRIKKRKERGTRRQHLNFMDIREEILYLQIQGVTNLTPLTESCPEIQEDASKKNKIGSLIFHSFF
jgi:hypothetical protein